MADFVALLGTNGDPAILQGLQMPTSSLLSRAGHWAVIDCGLGVIEGIVDQGLALKDLGLVFISHLHPDH